MKSGKLTVNHRELKKRQGKEQKINAGIFTMDTK